MSKRTGHHCIVCGKSCSILHKLPHGKFYMCSGQCSRVVTQEINYAVPVVWTGLQDLLDRELITMEILEKLTPADERLIAGAVENYLWSGEILGEMYGDALAEGAVVAEQCYIQGIPKKMLALVNAASLKSNKAKAALEARLKGD
jgi:hypothetical protein